MKRVAWLTFLVSLLFVPLGPAYAQNRTESDEKDGPETKAEADVNHEEPDDPFIPDEVDFDAEAEEESRINPGGCPVLCSRYEACIEKRCVDTCRAGCRPGTYCTASGECEPVPEPRVPILTEEDRQRLSGAKSIDSKVLLFADVGGFFGFGVKPGLEYGQQHSMVTRVQFLNTGIMSHAVFAENEFQRFEWGFGASVGYRFYEAKWGNLRGFYYGGGLEYTVIRLSDRVQEGVHQILHSAAPFGEFGYRWVSGNFAYGFGPSVSLRYPIGTGFSLDNRQGCSSPVSCDELSSRRFEGTLHIEVGWFQ
jgi:hypothetical protein